MLSKCANPECTEQFRYLHLGKLFYLSPSIGLEMSNWDSCEVFHERFWLCDQCSRTMTLVWDGTHAKIVSLPDPSKLPKSNESTNHPTGKFTASASHHHQ